MLIKLVQDDVGVGVAPQLHDDAHAVAVGFVAQRGDAVDRLVAHQLGDFFHQPRFIDLVRQLGDDDLRLAAGHRFDVRLRPHGDDAAPGTIRAAHAFEAEDLPAGGEIRPLDDSHQLVHRRLRVIDEREHAVDDLAHVMGRNVRRHAYGDARRAVHQKLRELRREHRRLLQGLVVIRGEVHRFLVNILQHELGDLRHADLRVAHRRRRVAVHRAEIAMPVRQGIADGKVLRHAHDRVVHRAVAVRMIFTEHLADDTRRLLVRLVRAHARFLHRVEDPAMDGL